LRPQYKRALDEDEQPDTRTNENALRIVSSIGRAGFVNTFVVATVTGNSIGTNYQDIVEFRSAAGVDRRRRSSQRIPDDEQELIYRRLPNYHFMTSHLMLDTHFREAVLGTTARTLTLAID